MKIKQINKFKINNQLKKYKVLMKSKWIKYLILTIFVLKKFN